MDLLPQLAQGFSVALRPDNIFYCVVGALWGTVVGVLPGLGPLAGLTLLLPLTFYMEPPSAIIMLAGIFYGAMYGGSTTSILLRIPGEAASVITCIDGNAMARKGRAGPALVVAAIGSFFGGSVSIIGLMLFAPPLADIMLTVGPPAEFGLMLLALLVLSVVSSGPPAKTLAMILLGLLLSTVGFDLITASPRFTFGSNHLVDGISILALSIGLFGVSEILINLENVHAVRAIKPTLRSLVPRWPDLRASAPAIGRGTIIGFAFGIIPGISHVVSTFVSYAVEKRLSSEPEAFGTGKIEGVAGPETANNATTGSALIPLLVLGIPAIPATVVLLSALEIHGVQPGPLLISAHPDVFWGVVASAFIANFVLLVLNLPMVGIFVNLLRIPYPYLASGVLLLCIIGVYSVNFDSVEVMMMAVFGLLGYALRKFKFDMAPLIIAVIIGERLELSFRRSLVISNGDYWTFLQGNAARVFLGAIAVLFLLQAVAWSLGFRRKVLREAED